jgi:hypothetical protein
MVRTASIACWFRTYSLLLVLLVAQLGFWYKTHDITPDMGVVPDVPGREALHALTFGDDQFYFRILAFNIQNAGDTFGRFTALRDYNFKKLYHWFTLLDELDPHSNMMPSMATYYFSQTQNTKDVRYVVDYLYEHASRDVGRKWWWLVQAIYLSMHKLDDKDLALKVSAPLVNPDVPAWAQQMAAVVREKRGEMADALRIMETIRDNAKEIKDADLKFMTYFIKERLGKLERKKAPTLRELKGQEATPGTPEEVPTEDATAPSEQ